MATQKKIDTVTKLTDKIEKSKSLIFADYVGLKHKQLEELRKSLTKIDAEFVVTKNKLLERALGTRAKDALPIMKKSTATLFNYKDEISGLKEMLKFFKAANIGSAKGGFLGKSVLNDKDVERLAKLPNRDQLLGQLAGQLNAPIQSLHYALSWNINKLVYALSAIKEKKTN
jgi:large subunit ribosomal protein L10